MTDLPKCPDCGAPMSVREEREIGQEQRKDGLFLMYARAGRLEEWKALPDVLGREVGQWRREEKCSCCAYEAVNGRCVARSR